MDKPTKEYLKEIKGKKLRIVYLNWGDTIVFEGIPKELGFKIAHIEYEYIKWRHIDKIEII